VAASEFGEWFATVFVAANIDGHGLFALKLMADGRLGSSETTGIVGDNWDCWSALGARMPTEARLYHVADLSAWMPTQAIFYEAGRSVVAWIADGVARIEHKRFYRLSNRSC
jgi:hypothetical protein